MKYFKNTILQSFLLHWHCCNTFVYIPASPSRLRACNSILSSSSEVGGKLWRLLFFALFIFVILLKLLVLSLIPTINYAAAMSWLSSPYPQNALKFWGSVRTCFVILVFVICPSFWFKMLIIYLFHYDFIFALFSFSI